MTINYWQDLEEGSIYHIYNHASGNRNLFVDDLDYRRFLVGLNKYFSHIFEIYAYCLMPNHFHLLIKVKPGQKIKSTVKAISSNAESKYLKDEIDLNKYCEDQFRRWFSGYALYLNKRTNTKGQLFLKRIKKISIDQEKRMLYLLCYIHHNPIHHGFRKEYGLWKYCSYSNYITNKDKHAFNNITKIGKMEDMTNIHTEFKVDYENTQNLD